MKKSFAITFIVAIASCYPRICPAQHDDIEVGVDNGRLVTEPRIGEGMFGEPPNAANVADGPGFEVDDGVFNSGESLAFNVLSVLGQHLWFWDGTGPVDFGASPETLTIRHPVTNQSVLLDSTGGAMTLPGFLIGFADSDGGLHQDLDFVLGTDPPVSGVYLFAMEMTSDAYDPAEPLYMVLGAGVDDPTLDVAVDWVAATFNIPEPSATMLLALGLLTSLRGRRQ